MCSAYSYVCICLTFLAQAGDGKSCGVMAQVLDYGLEINEIEFHSCYYVHFQVNDFGKAMDSLMSPAMGWIGSLLALVLNYPWSLICY